MQRAAGMIGLGEALVDLAVGAREEAGSGLALTARPGGSPANVAVGLARLGVKTQFAARISRADGGAWRPRVQPGARADQGAAPSGDAGDPHQPQHAARVRVADRIHIQRLGRCVGVVTPHTHTMEEAVSIMTGASVLEPAD